MYAFFLQIMRPLGFGVRQPLGCDFLLLPTMGQTMSWSNAIALVQQGYILNIHVLPPPCHFFLDLRYPFLPSAHFLLSLFVTQEGNKLVGMSGNIDVNQSTTNLSLLLSRLLVLQSFCEFHLLDIWTTSHPSI